MISALCILVNHMKFQMLCKTLKAYRKQHLRENLLLGITEKLADERSRKVHQEHL
jgi:hypothetical protein